MRNGLSAKPSSRRAAVIQALLAIWLVLPGAIAQEQQVRFNGRVIGNDGSPIPNAVIVLCNADANLWFLTSTDSAGAFELAGLPASRLSVEVLSPQWRRPTGNPGRLQVWGFNPWNDTVFLQAGQTLQREIQLGGFGQQSHSMEAAPPCSPQRPRGVLGADGLASFLVEETPAVYPRNLNGSPGEGRVNLEAFMNSEGKVISLRLLAPSWPPTINPLLTRAAVEAVRGWLYRPPRLLSGQELFEFGGPIAVNFGPQP